MCTSAYGVFAKINGANMEAAAMMSKPVVKAVNAKYLISK